MNDSNEWLDEYILDLTDCEVWQLETTQDRFEADVRILDQGSLDYWASYANKLRVSAVHEFWTKMFSAVDADSQNREIMGELAKLRKVLTYVTNFLALESTRLTCYDEFWLKREIRYLTPLENEELVSAQHQFTLQVEKLTQEETTHLLKVAKQLVTESDNSFLAGYKKFIETHPLGCGTSFETFLEGQPFYCEGETARHVYALILARHISLKTESKTKNG